MAAVAVGSVVSDEEIIDELRTAWAEVSRGYARYWAAMAETARRTTTQWETAEIAAALRFTARRADYELGCAQTLVDHLPQVHAALASGELDHHKARVFSDYLAEATAAQAERICAECAEGPGRGQRPRPAHPRGIGTPRPVRYGIEVRVRLSTLLGLDEHPAELPGWAPSPLRQPGIWSPPSTPLNGASPWSMPRGICPTVISPAAAPEPALTTPAMTGPDADLDHTRDYAHGGQTTTTNSGPCCARDHAINITVAGP